MRFLHHLLERLWLVIIIFSSAYGSAVIQLFSSTKLEAVVSVVGSSLDNTQAESSLAVVSRSLHQRYKHLSKINMAAALMLYRII